MAVGADAQVDEVELAQLAQAELVRLGSLFAPHRIGGVGGADPVEQCLPDQAVVRPLVVERHTALVAPIEVDLPPVDLGVAVVGQPLVAVAGRVAA